MATQKLAQSDIDIIQDALNRVHYYARRDARQTVINGKPKSAGKLQFDRQYYEKVMVLVTVIKHFTGLEPQELAETNTASFFQKFGTTIEDFSSNRPAPVNNNDVPF